MGNPKITYANITATLALVLALGGTSYAAVQLPKNSVKAKQIAANAVRAAEVKDGVLSGADLQDGSLTGVDVKDGSVGTTDLDAATVAGMSRPRAWGVINANGTLDAGRSSSNITSSGNTGVYCIKPTAGSGIDPATMAVLATADFSGAGTHHLAQTNYDAPGTCPNGVAIYTATEGAATFDYSADKVTFIVP